MWAIKLIGHGCFLSFPYVPKVLHPLQRDRARNYISYFFVVIFTFNELCPDLSTVILYLIPPSSRGLSTHAGKSRSLHLDSKRKAPAYKSKLHVYKLTSWDRGAILENASRQ